MELTGLIFEAARFLWLIFLVAAPIAISLTISGKARIAARLVIGECLLTFLIATAGLAASGMSHAAGWDSLGVLFWSAPALLVAGVTGLIVIGIVFAKKVAEGGARER